MNPITMILNLRSVPGGSLVEKIRWQESVSIKIIQFWFKEKGQKLLMVCITKSDAGGFIKSIVISSKTFGSKENFYIFTLVEVNKFSTL